MAKHLPFSKTYVLDDQTSHVWLNLSPLGLNLYLLEKTFIFSLLNLSLLIKPLYFMVQPMPLAKPFYFMAQPFPF
jgi:hypothetical protein